MGWQSDRACCQTPSWEPQAQPWQNRGSWTRAWGSSQVGATTNACREEVSPTAWTARNGLSVTLTRASRLSVVCFKAASKRVFTPSACVR